VLLGRRPALAWLVLGTGTCKSPDVTEGEGSLGRKGQILELARE